MDRQKLDLARADFEFACKERQKNRPCTNDMCEECELKVAIDCINRVQELEKENAELRKIIFAYMNDEDIWRDMCEAICNKDCPHKKNGECISEVGKCYATDEETLETYLKARLEGDGNG